MDFKVAGTKDGITALQMDIKVAGITSQIMREALAQAQRGRLFILGKMDEIITEGRVRFRPTRLASTPCRFPSTRSAT